MYKLLVYSDELYHYGVKGMRWGVRRYQNYDGSRIKGGPVTNPSHSGHPQRIRDTVVGGQGGKAKGSAQLAANASGAKDGDKKKSIAEVLTEPSVRQGKGKDNISPLEDAARDVNKVTDSGKKLTEIGKKYDPKVKEVGDKAEQEAKKMSDKELRDKINRIKMEKEYRSLAESDIESGWDKAHEILEVAGDVVTIIGSLASLYLTYKLAKGKIGHSDTSDAEHELKSFMESNEFDDEVIAHFMDLDDDYVEDFLEHHGVKGMRWGVRRYQNYDGTRISTGTPNITKPSSLGGGVGSGAGGGGGGSRKASSSFRNSIVGGQGGNATGNARLAATAGGPSKKRSLKDYAYVEPYRDENNKVRLKFTSDGPKPFKIPPKNKISSEPEGYSSKRQRYEAKLARDLKNAKTSKERNAIAKELNDYKKESSKKAKEYLQWEKQVKRKVGNTKNYDPIKEGKKFTGQWINRHSGEIISNKEYWTAGNYDTLPFWKKLI